MWVGVGGHCLWVNGERWGYIFGRRWCLDIIYRWVGDRQRYILNRWSRVDIFYRWLGIFGGRLRYTLFGWVWLDIFLGE